MTNCARIRLILLVIAATVMSALPVKSAVRYLTGQVRDTNQDGIVGATVMAHIDDSLIAGTATDLDGAYVLKLRNLTAEQVLVTASAVGFLPTEARVGLAGKTTVATLVLEATDIEIDGVKIYPTPDNRINTTRTTRAEIVRAARTSLVPTNPISAIKRPQVVREGSAHSSKLRVHGTSPKYFINGVEIGTNPSHYGVFSFIPSSVVERMQFSSLGASAAHDQSSLVEFETGSPFDQPFSGELNLSLMEATGSWSIGGKRWFVLGALRKSVLDKIVNQFDIDQNRRTIPPTNFQDVFASSGLKLSSGVRLTVDQYHVRDYLSFQTDATTQNSEGTHTALQTSEQYFGLRLDVVTGPALLKFCAATRNSREWYIAHPNSIDANGLSLDLNARTRTHSLSSEAILFLGDLELAMGDRVEYVSEHRIDLHQQNWNFLPPDANSDNPFLYQPELNYLYGDYHGGRTQLRSAAYTSLHYHIGSVEVTSGARLHTFRDLRQGTAVGLREEVLIPTGKSGRLRFFYGTFFESPVQKVLEPYQVLIQADLEHLEPIRTTLLSAGYQLGPVHLQAFRKLMENLPIAAPDVSAVDNSGQPIDGFIRMHSSGSGTFVGGNLSLQFDRLLNGRLNLYAYYGYTDARRRTGTVVVPYEINAPHRFFSQVHYQLSRRVALGADLSVRSGYSFTPTPSSATDFGDNRYSTEYWTAAQQTENTRRFPLNASLNLHASFTFGRTDLYLSVSNVTNRGNALVNTYDGYVYDAGILPTIGLTTRF